MESSYIGDNIDLLRELEPLRRSWQLKVEGHWPGEISPDTMRELDSILERIPDMPSLTLHFEGGMSAEVTRDFPSEYLNSVDRGIAKMFQEDASLLGISFPAHGRYPGHCATRQEPSWSPYKMESTRILGRLRNGEIGEEEAFDLLRDLSSPEENAGAFIAVRMLALEK